MRSSRRALWRACVIAASACLVLAGCSARQSKEQYEEHLADAMKVRTEVTSGLDAQQFESPAQFEEASKRIAAAREDLDEAPPPRNLQGAHDAMLRGMDGLADVLDQLGQCAALDTNQQASCRRAIDQSVYDEIRNDFDEANTIYQAEGISSVGDGGDEETGDSPGEDPEGGDEL